jgi:hypothetical protein
MLLPRSYAWTPLQKWLIVTAAVLVVAAAAASIYYYERHYRGPSDTVFVGTWQEVDVSLPDGACYYTFKSDHS